MTRLQERDFAKCVDYFKALQIDQNVFLGEKKALVKTAHSVAFAMNVFANKLSDIPKWAVPYLNLLKSDTIHAFSSAVMGEKRTLHLYERAGIEDFLRYIYFFDHKIEHTLLQTYPKKFQNVASMIDWLEEYPSLIAHQKAVSENCGILASCYAELSRTVHGTTLADQQIIESLKDHAGKNIDHQKEEKALRSLFGAIFFLLSAFHIETYRQLQLDERTLICQHLSEKQIEELSGLRH